MRIDLGASARTAARRTLRRRAGAAAAAALLGVATGAGAASDIAQQPLISSTAGEPNVMLMMDDSNSMLGTQLPAPADFDWYTFATGWGWGTVQNNGGGTTPVSYYDPYLYTPQINPLHYNPAITYRPWNDNNKPAASNFPPAHTGTYDGSGTMTLGTPMDMRYIQDGVTRIRANTAWANLFDRIGTRGGVTCQNWSMQTTTVVVGCNAWSSVTSPDGATSSYCSDPVYDTQLVNVCTQWDSYPNLIPARYYRIEGTWAADRYDITKYRLVEIDRAFPARMYPTPVDPRTGVRAQRSDCANPINCTYGEESQNFANWYTYYRNRLFATIAVTSQVLASLDSPLRLGYGRLNYFAGADNPWPYYSSNTPGATLPALDGVANPGHIVRGVRDFSIGRTDRQDVFDWLFTLNVAGGTPNREALDAAGRYFSRSDARGPWSSNPGTGPGGGTADLSCRRSYTILATDGVWTEYTAAQNVHPRIADRYAGAGTPIESDSVAGPSLTGGGAQAGLNYQYLPANEPALTTNAAQTGTLTDVAHYYWSRDLRPDLLNNNAPTVFPGVASPSYPGGYFDPSTWQNMRTIILGYGMQASQSSDSVMTAMRDGVSITWPAVNYGDPYDVSKIADTQRAAMAGRGNFYAAMDTSALTAGLASAFNSIGNTRASAANLGVSAAVIRDANDLAFESSYVNGEWSGAVTAIEALPLASGTRNVRWTASVPASASRKIFTSTARTAATTFAWANLSTAQQADLGDADLVDYVRGDDAREAPAGPYRTRTSLLGTFVHSTPLYSKATNHGLHRGPTAGGTLYANYLATKASSRAATVMINGNDGMLHAFDAATGVESFAYLPRAVMPQLRAYADPAYNHFYLVDGQVSEGDAYLGGGWKTVVVGTGGAGPKSLFALDVTNPASFSAAKVMFDLTDAEVPDLGHIMGRVLVASTVAGKWVAITGNGIESANERAVLLVIDLSNGQVLKTIDTGVGSSTARNGLGPVTPVYNAKRDVIGLYAGDRLGNVWKFDLSSTDVDDWGIARVGAAPAAPLFTATDNLGNRQPITTEIRVTDHPLGGLYLAFGTGQYIGTADVSDTRVQSMIFLRDRGDVATIAKSTLKQATLSNATGAYLKLSGLGGAGGLDWSTHRGWTVDLKIGATLEGERIIASPVIASGKVSFTSFRPAQSDPCTGGGSSSIYTFDLASGLQTRVFDGQASDVIGIRLNDGLPGGIIPLYVKTGGAGTVVSSIDGDELQALTASTRYTIGSGGAIGSTGSSSICGAAGATTRSTALAVPSACSGMLPLRTWRDMR